ncbi:P-loop containing nucleoside triphosphate hydrolase protein [Imleria badia]|nr:P-loop containing nucleoside triphosphate hydrolase protein [Imleria badia]
MARTAAEETRKATEAKEEAERLLKEGIQPVVTPSPEELAAAKRRIQYREDCFHFAVAGISGSGKSSLVNAFRGLRSRAAGAAAVGVTETTLQMTRYPDANPENPYVWYDIPGAGTLKCRDWQYFNEQGLYVFDCIIVLFDNRFTMTDIAILVNARRFNIPTYIVRSKADQHIRNVMMDMGYDSEGDEEEDVERRNKLSKAARKQFIEKTRKSVKANLEDANLPDQRVYIVSNNTMLSIVLNKTPKKTIDEVDLLNDLLNEAYTRRRRATHEETRKATEAKEEAERRLKEGIQPVVTPSPEELATARKRIQYREDCFHFAVAGISGGGKSSLVNSFRGLRSRDAGAAAVGVTETTLQMTRYPDANPENPFVWYDIPGAGTLKCRDWQYFNEQGLYVFDCIIVLFDNRFTVTDIAILVNARRFNIPTYIVRSKADQHIRNVMVEKGYDSGGDDEEDLERRNKLYKAARKQFIKETRKSVRANLEDANLPDQRVYLVSNTTMLSIVLNKVPKKTIDEVDLLNDLLNQVYSRRVTRSDEMPST